MTDCLPGCACCESSSAPPLTEWEIAAIARSSAREAFAWACCIAFVGGMTVVSILMAW